VGNYRAQILTYIDQISRRRWTALAVAWVVCIIGWGIVSLLPDSFQSEARIYVDTQSLLNPLLKGISVRADDQRDQDIAVMQQTLTSRPNLEKVAQLTDLDKTVKSPAGLQKLIDKLQQHIDVTNQGHNLFKVDFTDNSPETAKRVVQALLAIFVESNVGDRRTDMQSARAFIESQLAEYNAKLVDAERRLADFKVANVDYIADASQSFAARLEQARMTVKQRSDDVEDLTEQAAELKSQLAATPQFLAVDAMPQVIVGQVGPPLRQQIRALQSKIDELRVQYTDKYPEILRSREVLKELQAQATKASELSGNAANSNDNGYGRSEIVNEVYAQMSLRLSDLEEKLRSAKHQREDAKEALADLQNRSSRAPGIEAQYTALTRDYQVLKSNYDELLARRESARIAEAADSSTDAVQFRIIAEPEQPAFPSGPKRRIFNAIVFVLGAAAGCATAVGLAEIEDCITAPDDLRKLGRGAVFGCITDAATLLNFEPFFKRHGKIIIYAGALSLLCLISVLAAPNLSTLPQAIASEL
jgi:polysaccharide chain length determinant protein (PEP-CTERM system associated)